jgi:DnaJ-class molecular chaperone
MSKTIICPTCRGTGIQPTVRTWEPSIYCLTCEGAGLLRVEPAWPKRSHSDNRAVPGARP